MTVWLSWGDSVLLSGVDIKIQLSAVASFACKDLWPASMTFSTDSFWLPLEFRCHANDAEVIGDYLLRIVSPFVKYVV